MSSEHIDLTQSFNADPESLARWEAGEDRDKFGARVLVGDDLEIKEWVDLTQAELDALRLVAVGDWGIPEEPCRSLESKGLVAVSYYWTLTDLGRAVVEAMERVSR